MGKPKIKIKFLSGYISFLFRFGLPHGWGKK